GAGEAAGAPVEMEPQRQRVQMPKHGQGDLPYRALSDLGENGVAQFVESARHYPGRTVGEDQGDRHRHDIGCGQGVDRMLVEERHHYINELRSEQEQERDDDAEPQLQRIARPQVWVQRAERPQPVDHARAGWWQSCDARWWPSAWTHRLPPISRL